MRASSLSLLTWALVGCAGAAERPAPAADAIAVESTRCSPLGLPVVAPRGVTTADLQRALGHRLSDPVVRGLAERLGRPLDDRAYGLLDFHDQGITLVVDDEQRIEAIDLHGRTFGVRSYPGALPSGLSFAHRSDDVAARLGEPLACTAAGRCAYAGGGIEIVYGPDACVSTITMRLGAAAGTALVLSEGTHTLRPRIVVEKRSPSGEWSEVPVRFVHGKPPSITLEQPRCQWHRFGVHTVRVAKRDYDAGSNPPDLRWRVELDERTVHASSVRSDVFAGRWTERTPWFRACQRDGIAIDVVDVDAAFHDTIAGRTIELTDLARIADARAALSFDAVEELVLSPIERHDTLPGGASH